MLGMFWLAKKPLSGQSVQGPPGPAAGAGRRDGQLLPRPLPPAGPGRRLSAWLQRAGAAAASRRRPHLVWQPADQGAHLLCVLCMLCMRMLCMRMLCMPCVLSVPWHT